MGKEKDLDRLQNHLFAQEAGEKHTAHVYNADHTDVDLEEYTRDVCEKPRRGSCLGVILVGLFVATAIFLYLAWGGFPWK